MYFRLKDINETIFVRNKGMLEVPRGKHFWELPLDHYLGLIKKHGQQKIVRALTNLVIWNKIKHAERSKQAADIIAKINSALTEKKPETVVPAKDKITPAVPVKTGQAPVPPTKPGQKPNPPIPPTKPGQSPPPNSQNKDKTPPAETATDKK